MTLSYKNKAIKVHKVATHYIVKENIFSSKNKYSKAITQREFNEI